MADKNNGELKITPEHENDIEVLAKLSARTICGDVRSMVKPGEKTLLFEVNGTAEREDTGETARGKWRALVGRFIVTRADGAKFFGSKLYLPNAAHDLFAFGLYGDDDESLHAVKLRKFRVYLREAQNPIGYEYSFSSGDGKLTQSFEVEE